MTKQRVTTTIMAASALSLLISGFSIFLLKNAAVIPIVDWLRTLSPSHVDMLVSIVARIFLAAGFMLIFLTGLFARYARVAT